MSTCTGPGPGPSGACPFPAHANGLCTSHIKQQQRGRKLAPVRTTRQPAVCPGPQCDRLAVEGPLCRTHSRQRRAGKELTPIEARQPLAGRTCPGPGDDGNTQCGRRIHSRGLCATHAVQQRRGEPLRPLRRADRLCDVDGCEEKHFGKGLCERHYKRMRAGLPPEGLPPKPVACTECGGKVHARGLCVNHYHAAWRAKQGRTVGRKPRADKPQTLRAVRTSKAKVKPEPSNLPPNWFKPSPKPARPARENSEEMLNMSMLMGPDPYVDPEKRDEFVAYLRRRGDYELLDALGLAS